MDLLQGSLRIVLLALFVSSYQEHALAVTGRTMFISRA